MTTYRWEPVESVTLRPGDGITVYIADGEFDSYLLLNIERIEDDPNGGVVPRLYTVPGVALA